MARERSRLSLLTFLIHTVTARSVEALAADPLTAAEGEEVSLRGCTRQPGSVSHCVERCTWMEVSSQLGMQLRTLSFLIVQHGLSPRQVV